LRAAGRFMVNTAHAPTRESSSTDMGFLK